MKRNTKHLFSLILAVVMMLSMTISGFAAGIVTYKSEGEKFEFKPGTEYSDTDLFTDFKEMMPGDNKSQEIRFVYNGKDGVTANVYLQMKLPASDFKANDKTKDAKLLEAIVLTVKAEDGTVIYSGPANEGNMESAVKIAQLRKGKETTITVTAGLDLVKTDNEVRNMAAAIDWVFKIEEIPDPVVVPDTGDNTGALMYAGMFGAAAMALFVLIVLKKRTREE